MRVCPKCGYVDPPEWRHSRFSYWIDLCNWIDFKKLHLELAKELERNPKIVVEDKNYLYRVEKTMNFVFRKAKVDYGNQWQIPMEKRTGQIDFRKYWNIDRLQKKIGDFLNVEA